MKTLGLAAMLIALLFALCFGMALPFMWIWNYAVVQAVTFANPIDYWVAFWLMMFCVVFLASSSRTSVTPSK